MSIPLNQVPELTPEEKASWAEYTNQPLPKETVIDKLSKFWNSKIVIPLQRLTDNKKRYIFKGIKPAWSTGFSLASAKEGATGLVETAYPNPEALNLLIPEFTGTYKPRPGDTAHDIASQLSQRACDFTGPGPIVAIHPISGELRKEVLNLLQTRSSLYPMFEYEPANLVSNDDLDAQSIIYRYNNKHASRYFKPF